MADPYLSEIRILSSQLAPPGWALCNGQVMLISQNQDLFKLLGTLYGGDGKNTFGLPDLRGRVPMHVGGGHNLGERGGEKAHILSNAEMPAHSHVAVASGTPAATNIGTDGLLAVVANTYSGENNLVDMGGAEIGITGAGEFHPNMQPYLGLNFMIALQGTIPT